MSSAVGMTASDFNKPELPEELFSLSYQAEICKPETTSGFLEDLKRTTSQKVYLSSQDLIIPLPACALVNSQTVDRYVNLQPHKI